MCQICSGTRKFLVHQKTGGKHLEVMTIYIVFKAVGLNESQESEEGREKESVTESGILANNEFWKGRVNSKVMWRSEQ